MLLDLRIITARLPKNYKKYVTSKYLALYLRNFLLLFLMLVAGVLLQILVILENHYEEARVDFAARSSEYHYWSSISAQFPNIPDILYDAALSAYNAGHRGEALRHVDKALLVDPLFKKAQKLKKEILEG